ncbi:hypothetical protein WR25_17467 isoform C [Diploscapter pachys]|uniref:tRNA(Phe) (4-demethylwyosine(37)-C(7)) aminocarboxypropyltransferase n=1 Tax=Diploscapter pachys TaxID=2018661 RepID=A0A2A2K7J9_9BILA|nr:hypothetical protein WR25_17467 isoform B [Diploscapter pachys]PAV69780.1 hypothetical protein WR25_17467 isoform C [Diploscapter pachys]
MQHLIFHTTFTNRYFQNSFTHNNWRYIGRGLWKVVAESLKIEKLGRERVIDDDSFRTAHVDLLYGDNAWIEYVDERGIRFQYEASKRVYNNQKSAEMKRISEWDCHGETIVDMYAGLGNFAFTFLIACHAKKVVAIDWDEDMIEALLRTAEINGVSDQLLPIQGDTRRMTPTGIADRVYLGLIPSCRAHWLAACKAVKPEAGMIHISELLKIGERRKSIPIIPPQITAIKKSIISKLPSVDEEGSSKENKPVIQEAPKPKPKLKDIGKSKTEAGNATSEKKPVKKVVKKKEPKKDTANQNQEKKSETEAENSEKKPEEEEYYIDENGEKRVKRKFSRSASIVEEMESRVLPAPRVYIFIFTI